MNNRSSQKDSVTSPFSRAGRSRKRHGSDPSMLAENGLIAEIQQLRKDVLSISSFERERIGHELHDDFTQNLAGIACLSKQLHGRLREKNPALARLAEEMTEEVYEVLERVRAVSHEFAPSHLEEWDLAPCLQKLVETMGERTGVRFENRIDRAIQIDDVTVRLHLYRITQEALGNAIRHGRATTITVELIRETDFSIRLSIEDNGLGFHRDAPTSDGLGIRLMQYRCRQIGATLTLRNTDNGGAAITCVLPVRDEGIFGERKEELE